MVDGMRRIDGCRCDDQNRNKEIERVARLDSTQWRSRIAAVFFSFVGPQLDPCIVRIVFGE